MRAPDNVRLCVTRGLRARKSTSDGTSGQEKSCSDQPHPLNANRSPIRTDFQRKRPQRLSRDAANGAFYLEVHEERSRVRLWRTRSSTHGERHRTSGKSYRMLLAKRGVSYLDQGLSSGLHRPRSFRVGRDHPARHHDHPARRAVPRAAGFSWCHAV